MDKLARRIRPSCRVPCWSAKVIPDARAERAPSVWLSCVNLAGCQNAKGMPGLAAGATEVPAADTVQLPGRFNEIEESHLGAGDVSPFDQGKFIDQAIGLWDVSTASNLNQSRYNFNVEDPARLEWLLK